RQMAILQIQQQNVSAPSAFTEYSFALPPRVSGLTIQLRASDTLYVYTAPSGSSSPGSASNLPATYITIPVGARKTWPTMLGGQAVYFQVATSQVGQALEVDYYGDN